MELSCTQHHSRQCRRGFSLLEMVVTLGVAGTVLAGVWQLLGTGNQVREAAGLASQALALSAASQQYITAQRTTLLALGGLANLNDVVRIKILDSDTGATATSVQGAGYLPLAYVNQNSYGQTYHLYVRREDGGTLGSADANDRLVGLVISTGGATIADTTGTRVVSIIGAPGGFLYREDNPAPPTAATSIRGAGGGWTIDLTAAGWSTIGATATAGHLALLTNLTPKNTSGSGGVGGNAGGGGGSSNIDGLNDAAADYNTLYNLFLGQDAGAENVDGEKNIAVGYEAMKNMMPGAGTGNNVAVGYLALRGSATPASNTGHDNIALGSEALLNLTSGARNVAIGFVNSQQTTTASDRVTIGSGTGSSNNSPGLTAIGDGAAVSALDGSYSTYIGNSTGMYPGRYNTSIGARATLNPAGMGDYNVAVGYEALRNVGVGGNYNVAIGYRAGDNITTGSNNIIIGRDVDAPSATGSNQLNIGNFIYGNTSTKQVRLANSTLVPGIAFDVGSFNNAFQVAVGTTAQRPTCEVDRLGAMRMNSSLHLLEFCNGSAWVQATTVSASSAPAPSAPSTTGYFVLTAGTWDGNLGGFQGADDKCLSDLTANDWNGKADAVSRNLLVADKVRAFICGESAMGVGDTCSQGRTLTTYAFARSGDLAAGGATFTTDSAGAGPNEDVNNWSGATYFNTSQTYWANRYGSSSTTWSLNEAKFYCGGGNCSNFTSNSGAISGWLGNPNSTNASRFGCTGGGSATCNTAQALVCFVDP